MNWKSILTTVAVLLVLYYGWTMVLGKRVPVVG